MNFRKKFESLDVFSLTLIENNGTSGNKERECRTLFVNM